MCGIRRFTFYGILVFCLFLTGCLINDIGSTNVTDHSRFDRSDLGLIDTGTSSEVGKWSPFEDMTGVVIYEFDSNNILGLSGIYIKNEHIIIRFTKKMEVKEDGIRGITEGDKYMRPNSFKTYTERNDFIMDIEMDEISSLEGIKVDLSQEWDLFRIYSFSNPTLYLWRGEYGSNNIFANDTKIQDYDSDLKQWREPKEEHDEHELNMGWD